MTATAVAPDPGCNHLDASRFGCGRVTHDGMAIAAPPGNGSCTCTCVSHAKAVKCSGALPGGGERTPTRLTRGQRHDGADVPLCETRG